MCAGAEQSATPAMQRFATKLRHPRRPSSSASGTDPSRRAARRKPRQARRSGLPACASAAARTAGLSQRKNGLTRISRRTCARAGSGLSAARSRATLSLIVERRADWPAPPSRRSAGWRRCIRDRNTSAFPAASSRSRFNEAFICLGVPSNIRPQPALNSVSPQNSAPWPQNAMWLKRMSGHLQNIEAKSQVRQVAALAVAHGAGALRDARIVRSHDRHRAAREQLGHAANMIGMMVSE